MNSTSFDGAPLRDTTGFPSDQPTSREVETTKWMNHWKIHSSTERHLSILNPNSGFWKHFIFKCCITPGTNHMLSPQSTCHFCMGGISFLCGSALHESFCRSLSLPLCLLALHIFAAVLLTHFFQPIQKMVNMCQRVQTSAFKHPFFPPHF